MPDDFETHESGTFQKLDENAARIDRLERERQLMMSLLHWTDEDLDRALDIFERSRDGS